MVNHHCGALDQAIVARALRVPSSYSADQPKRAARARVSELLAVAPCPEVVVVSTQTNFTIQFLQLHTVIPRDKL